MLWLAGLLISTLAWAEPVDFSLPDLDGRMRSLSEFRGKWVLVNYWATWCPPCLEELPDLETFHNAHKDKDAVVIGVNLEEISADRLRSFVEEQFLSFPILRGKPGWKTALGPVRSLPTSYLITPDGEVVARQIGMVSGEMVETFIKNYRPPAEE
ncbi:MAG TPA: TlpA family protein disulfide reductase [Sedimenticola thiotaurini]|uniref:TlpA family protein disulfide reductase n=1 Tax=Sedimenticola thiotaurini TaxID=1543721 RepID=A0A831RME2_9GAMM|nr:TlpA family protein disulfide reductase [Sedimenticola thiotaurini]